MPHQEGYFETLVCHLGPLAFQIKAYPLPEHLLPWVCWPLKWCRASLDSVTSLVTPHVPRTFFLVFMPRALKSRSSCIDDPSFALFPIWLFEEQQAFEKSHKLLQQLEIYLAENPSHHRRPRRQAPPNCADRFPQGPLRHSLALLPFQGPCLSLDWSVTSMTPCTLQFLPPPGGPLPPLGFTSLWAPLSTPGQPTCLLGTQFCPLAFPLSSEVISEGTLCPRVSWRCRREGKLFGAGW